MLLNVYMPQSHQDQVVQKAEMEEKFHSSFIRIFSVESKVLSIPLELPLQETFLVST